jgi:predicted amidophosphoribosyltransferase
LGRSKNILLVDDVFTTVARANEAIKTLKTARPGKNYIYTLGRVIVVKGLGS